MPPQPSLWLTRTRILHNCELRQRLTNINAEQTPRARCASPELVELTGLFFHLSGLYLISNSFVRMAGSDARLYGVCHLYTAPSSRWRSRHAGLVPPGKTGSSQSLTCTFNSLRANVETIAEPLDLWDGLVGVAQMTSLEGRH